MVSENEFHEILEEKKLMEQCRKVWWEHWKPYQAKFGGSKEALEELVTAAKKNGCKVPCGL